MPTLVYVQTFLLLISPCVGSFLAVLIDRLGRGEDVVRAPSACRTCGARLGLLDLVPILSFALNKGCCRRCKAAIPPWLLYTELLATGAAVLAVIAGFDAASTVLFALFLWVLIALAGADLLWLRLFDVLTGALVVIALALALLPGGPGFGSAILGGTLGAGSFAVLRWVYWRLRRVQGLGLGDVKLMAGLGAYATPMHLPLLVLIGAGLALLIALIQRARDPLALDRQRALPFGAALCAAGFIIWLVRATYPGCC